MSKNDLVGYYNWFINKIPERLLELECTVRSHKQFNDWSADKSSNSLIQLGEWYASNVESRNRTNEDISMISSGLKLPIEIPDYDLTNKSFSYAIDVAMYFSEVIRAEFPHVKWHQVFKNKNHAEYGRPILNGFGVVPLDPVRIMVTLAYGFVEHSQNGSRLHSLYAYWAQLAKNNL